MRLTRPLTCDKGGKDADLQSIRQTVPQFPHPHGILSFPDGFIR